MITLKRAKLNTLNKKFDILYGIEKEPLIHRPDKKVEYNIGTTKTAYLRSVPIKWNILETLPIKRINFCIYINNRVPLHPYIEYLLYKYSEKNSDICIFPFMKRSKKNIKLEISDFMKNTLQIEDSWSIKGYLIKDKNLYVFIKLTGKKKKNKDISLRNSSWWWALIDEICNQRHIMNFPIHEDVTNIFLHNPLLIYLRSTNGQNLEIPRVLYHGGSVQSIPFIFVFGPKSSVTGKYGPYYYLGTYKKAIRFAGWTIDYKSYKENDRVIADENGKFVKGGLVRYAVFLGKLRVLLNHPDDISTGEREFSSKLEDREGLWAKNYDSLYHGRVKISNKSGLLWRLNPEFITKDFQQQIPLSFHYIDKKTLQNNWDPTYNKYYIE